MQAPIRFTSAIPGAIAQRQGDQQALQQFFDRNKVEKARMEQIKSLKQLAKGYGASAAQVESSSYGELQGFVQRMELERADKTRAEQARLRELQMEQSRQAMELAGAQADLARQARDAPAKFLNILAGRTGSNYDVIEADEKFWETAPPDAGTPPAVYSTPEELEAAAVAEMKRRADHEQARADRTRLRLPLSEASSADFLKRFEVEQDPAVARLALEEFVRRGTPKPGGTFRTLMIPGDDGKPRPRVVKLDSAGNVVSILPFDAPGEKPRVLTPEEEAKVKEESIELEQAGEFLGKQRQDAYESAKVIIPASRSLRLLEKGGIDTGGLAEFKTDMIVLMNSLGIPLPDEMVKEAADAEEFRAQVGKFLFLNIQQTKGSISEKEMDIFKKISPNLDMSVAANKSLLKYIIARAEREKRKITFMQGLRKKGVPMRERRNLVEDWMLDNDLSEMITPIPSGRGGSANTIQVDLGGGQTAVGQQIGVNAAGERLFKLQDGRVVTENKAATAP